MFRLSCVHHQEDHLYMQFLWYVFNAEHTIRISARKHIKKTVCTNGLPDDEHMMFETCRRQQELN
jgi:hypothetical protein